jgi:hypothetical protein
MKKPPPNKSRPTSSAWKNFATHQGFFAPVGDFFAPFVVSNILTGLDAERCQPDLNTDAVALPSGIVLLEQLTRALVLIRLDCELEPGGVIPRWLTAYNHGTQPASAQAEWQGGDWAPTRETHRPGWS